MTPVETGELLERIALDTLASKQSCAEMRAILKRQQLGARSLKHFIDIPIAHKTGGLPPFVVNDAGIVYTNSGPIVITFFGMDISEQYGQFEDRIGHLSKRVVEYFAK